jgi:hypothetical protein
LTYDQVTFALLRNKGRDVAKKEGRNEEIYERRDRERERERDKSPNKRMKAI